MLGLSPMLEMYEKIGTKPVLVGISTVVVVVVAKLAVAVEVDVTTALMVEVLNMVDVTVKVSVT